MAYSITVNNNPLGRSIDAVHSGVEMNFSWSTGRDGFPRLNVNASVGGWYMDSHACKAADLAETLKESFLMGVGRSEVKSFAEHVWKEAEKIRTRSIEY